MEAMTLSSLITDAGTVASGLFGIAGDALSFATSSPILLFGMVASIVAMGIGVLVHIFHSFR